MITEFPTQVNSIGPVSPEEDRPGLVGLPLDLVF